MNGFGQKYHPFKSKETIGIFAVLSGIRLIPEFVPSLSMLSILSLPVDILHSATLGSAINMAGVSLGPVSEYAFLLTYYVAAVIIGYVYHSRSNSSSFP